MNLEPRGLAAVVILATALSAWSPADRLTWWLEALPVLIGLPLAAVSRRTFPLTALVYRLLALHALLLVLGAHYTYEKVPPGDWLKDALGLARNHYDRLGHLAQGFVPAILAREILLRRSPLKPGRWTFFLVVSVCLAFSALYELVEWWSALAFGSGAAAFLGTQGDPWDTQWDMCLALAGSIAAQLLLSRTHNAQLAALAVAPRE